LPSVEPVLVTAAEVIPRSQQGTDQFGALVEAPYVSGFQPLVRELRFTVTDDRIPGQNAPTIPGRPIARDCGLRRHAEHLLVVR